MDSSFYATPRIFSLDKQGEYHLCIMCFKALINHDYAVRKIIAEDIVLNKVTLSLQVSLRIR
jgi:hypothetical protein